MDQQKLKDLKDTAKEVGRFMPGVGNIINEVDRQRELDHIRKGHLTQGFKETGAGR